jgi:hypothetical protein
MTSFLFYFLSFFLQNIHYSYSGDNLLLGSLLSWVLNSGIWANIFHPAGLREGCGTVIEPVAAAQLPDTITTELCHILGLHRTILSYAARY